jgi:hypothetical protein
MKLDEATWRRLVSVLSAPDAAVTQTLAVAFVGTEDFAARTGSAWLWWPDGQLRATQPCEYDGRFPSDWGMLLVMSDVAIDTVCAEGESSMAGLVRRGKIMPFLLQQREALEAAGILDLIESLELATPKH